MLDDAWEKLCHVGWVAWGSGIRCSCSTSGDSAGCVGWRWSSVAGDWVLLPCVPPNPTTAQGEVNARPKKGGAFQPLQPASHHVKSHHLILCTRRLVPQSHTQHTQTQTCPHLLPLRLQHRLLCLLQQLTHARGHRRSICCSHLCAAAAAVGRGCHQPPHQLLRMKGNQWHAIELDGAVLAVLRVGMLLSAAAANRCTSPRE